MQKKNLKKLFSKNLLQYNFHKMISKNKMKNYSQVSRKLYNKYLKKMKLNMTKSMTFKRKIIMNIFLKKIIKKNLSLSYYQQNKILKKIKIKYQIFKI